MWIEMAIGSAKCADATVLFSGSGSVSKSPPKVGQAVVEPRKVLDAAMTERELLETVRAHAVAFRWAYYHTHDSRHSTSGFPDLVLAKPPRLLFVELKSEKGRLTGTQEAWLWDFDQCGVETYVWRPSDLSSGEIESVLRGGTQ